MSSSGSTALPPAKMRHEKSSLAACGQRFPITCYSVATRVAASCAFGMIGSRRCLWLAVLRLSGSWRRFPHWWAIPA